MHYTQAIIIGLSCLSLATAGPPQVDGEGLYIRDYSGFEPHSHVPAGPARLERRTRATELARAKGQLEAFYKKTAPFRKAHLSPAEEKRLEAQVPQWHQKMKDILGRFSPAEKKKLESWFMTRTQIGGHMGSEMATEMRYGKIQKKKEFM